MQLGTRLLASEMNLSFNIVRRVLQGHEMTRRERLQLVRTVADTMRLVPFVIIVIVPFMELALPFLLKLFPNMLPSTFQDKVSREQAMKRALQERLDIAGVMQETLQNIAAKSDRRASGDAGSTSKEVWRLMLHHDDHVMTYYPNPLCCDSCCRSLRKRE